VISKCQKTLAVSRKNALLRYGRNSEKSEERRAVKPQAR